MGILSGLKSIHYGRLVLTLAIAVAGGSLFALVDIPLPWMLGSLFACLMACFARIPVESPAPIRAPISAMIGVMLGSGYSPSLIGQLSSWWVTLLGLLFFLLISGGLAVLYFRKVARFDYPTAYFSGMPGGVAEMVLLGETVGADTTKIALIHSTRIIVAVFCIPFLVQWIEGVSIAASGGGNSISIAQMSLVDWAWLVGTYSAGLIVGRLFNLPSRYVLGPMLVSIAVHLSGLSSFRPPWELIVAAQVGLGTIIGCRFVGARVLEVLRVMLVSLGSSAIMILVSVAFAVTLTWLTPFSLVELLLAYSPGGLAEMGILAVALNLEVAMVSAHHILRILIVSVGAGLLMPVMRVGRVDP